MKEFASAAADRLSTTADYMRTHDAKRMMADVETVVKNNPGPALLSRRSIRVRARPGAHPRLRSTRRR